MTTAILAFHPLFGMDQVSSPSAATPLARASHVARPKAARPVLTCRWVCDCDGRLVCHWSREGARAPAAAGRPAMP